MKLSRPVIFICLFLMGLALSAVLNAGKTPVAGKARLTYDRIVCLNPAATETIFELGQENRLVAVSEFCDFPIEAQSLPRAGAVINPNLERIKNLEPDLVIVLGRSQNIADFCQDNCISVLRMNMQTLEEMYADIRLLGNMLGCSPEASELCSGIQSRLKGVQDRVKKAAVKSVFVSLYRNTGSLSGISTAGGQTLLSELIVIAGGKNIFYDVDLPYPTISKESLVVRKPEVIIEPCNVDLSASTREQLREDWLLMPQIPAVANGEIYMPDVDLLLKPGPRIGRAAEILAKLIHPELYSE